MSEEAFFDTFTREEMLEVLCKQHTSIELSDDVIERLCRRLTQLKDRLRKYEPDFVAELDKNDKLVSQQIAAVTLHGATKQ